MGPFAWLGVSMGMQLLGSFLQGTRRQEQPRLTEQEELIKAGRTRLMGMAAKRDARRAQVAGVMKGYGGLFHGGSSIPPNPPSIPAPEVYTPPRGTTES